MDTFVNATGMLRGEKEQASDEAAPLRKADRGQPERAVSRGSQIALEHPNVPPRETTISLGVPGNAAGCDTAPGAGPKANPVGKKANPAKRRKLNRRCKTTPSPAKALAPYPVQNEGAEGAAAYLYRVCGDTSSEKYATVVQMIRPCYDALLLNVENVPKLPDDPTSEQEARAFLLALAEIFKLQHVTEISIHPDMPQNYPANPSVGDMVMLWKSVLLMARLADDVKRVETNWSVQGALSPELADPK